MGSHEYRSCSDTGRCSVRRVSAARHGLLWSLLVVFCVHPVHILPCMIPLLGWVRHLAGSGNVSVSFSDVLRHSGALLMTHALP